MPPMKYIRHEPHDREAWLCECGNQPHSDGFYECDFEGKDQEPLIGSSWDGLYRCDGCGRIIDVTSHAILGQAAGYKAAPFPVTAAKLLAARQARTDKLVTP